MKRILLIIQALTLLTSATLAMNASASLVIKPVPVDKDHAHHNRRTGKAFNITGFENSQALLYTPTLEQRALKINNGQVKFRPTGMDNYHAIVVSKTHNDVEKTAIRYIYSFGKPSGHSPSEITNQVKSRLEIVPSPLPREHWEYKSNDDANFIVRFDGLPLVDKEISLSTSNGSIIKSRTDKLGEATFKLPDDFEEVKPGSEANEPGELLIHVKHTENGKKYATWLSSEYEVDPAHWRNTQLGAIVAGSGFLIGAFVTGLGFRKIKSKEGNN